MAGALLKAGSPVYSLSRRLPVGDIVCSTLSSDFPSAPAGAEGASPDQLLTLASDVQGLSSQRQLC